MGMGKVDWDAIVVSWLDLFAAVVFQEKEMKSMIKAVDSCYVDGCFATLYSVGPANWEKKKKVSPSNTPITNTYCIYSPCKKHQTP